MNNMNNMTSTDKDNAYLPAQEITADDYAADEKLQDLLTSLAPKLDKLNIALVENTNYDDIPLDFWLEDINRDLRQYPELTHMLTEEQISAIYRGSIAASGIVISEKQAKTVAKTAKKTGLVEGGRKLIDLL